MATSDDEAAGEVAAMQFAGGRPIARLAEEWERGDEWVEAAIRRALLAYIPKRDGGLKASRTEMRAARAARVQMTQNAQGEWERFHFVDRPVDEDGGVGS